MTPPLSAVELLTRFPHAVEGVVLAVDQRPRPATRGLVIADVDIALRVTRVRSGPLRAGDRIVFHGEAILRDDEGVVGASGTVPGSLVPGQMVAAVLADGGRLTVPHYSALTILGPHRSPRPWSRHSTERKAMAEYLHLLVGDVDRLARLVTDDGEPTRVFVPTLDSAFGIAPVTLAMVGNVGNWYGPLTTTEERALPPVDIVFGERFTAGGGALAYIESEEQAEFGHRAAALWRDGALVFGLDVDRTPPVPFVAPPVPRLLDRLLGRRPTLPPAPPLRPDPIDRALAGLAPAEEVAVMRRGMMLLRENADLLFRWIERPPPE